MSSEEIKPPETPSGPVKETHETLDLNQGVGGPFNTKIEKKPPAAEKQKYKMKQSASKPAPKRGAKIRKSRRKVR